MIRSYTPDDESAMLSLWNTAGAVMGYAPVPLEDFHRLLTRHPNFSPAYTFVLEEKGTLLGFVNGCTQNVTRGYGGDIQLDLENVSLGPLTGTRGT